MVVVVVVDWVLVVASPAGLADDIADESAGVADDIAEVSAGLVVVVVVSVVVVAEVSAFFWQAPRPQAMLTASITATVVRFVIGYSSRMRGGNEHASVMVP